MSDLSKVQIGLDQLRREYADAMLSKPLEPGEDASYVLGKMQGHYAGITAALSEIDKLIGEELERERQS